ncbi:prepilin peptidase [Pseudooceanicola nanhaiensis]|uniref:prepilin peptidase n=1 Tax=Pseudooceanicola nanhaiensis TaxID=375761 RepID=UPI001CD34AD0|nr:prepilin peptidase [Pseudooceanicola nanhaiensis]MCA0919478.1 hypothetical protein [Pseudooceanicola nanhaiensis]
MEISSVAAAVFLPFVLPLCAHVVWTDLAAMRISNRTVLLLAAVFVVIGPFVLPFGTYGWRLLALVVVLLAGMLANALGLFGAGDAKFIAAAAPFIAPGDIRLALMILAVTLATGFVTHRIAKRTALRRLAPNWESWTRARDYPMGLSLGPALVIYLALGALYGT